MQLAKAPLKRWLKQQQQMIGSCSSAVLVHLSDKGTFEFIGQASEKSSSEKFTLDKNAALALQEVSQKHRLHLAPVGANQMLLTQPIMQQGDLWGAVILYLDTVDKKNIAESLKLLQQGMIWLQFLLIQQEPTIKPGNEAVINETAFNEPAITNNSLAVQLLQMMSSLLKENTLQETAISLVNFLATQMQSSRVCLGLQSKTGIDLTAVSFSASFDKRTSAMQAITDVMDEAADQRINIHVDTETAENVESNIIQRCHEILLKQQSVAGLDSFLLRKESQVIGVITVEHRDARLTTEQHEFIQAALIMVRYLIVLKQDSETNISQQIKSHTLKKLNHWVGDNKLTRKLITGFALLAICILFFPANYWVASDASLQSTYKYLVVSPQDGYLASIKVRPGATVKKGDVLAQLDDEELRLERRKLYSQMQQSQQEYDNALANSNRAQAAIANEKVEQANSQLQLIEQQQLRTQLIAPSEGIITSDDISQSLGAPVKQGQTLFEISASQGYLVQLWIDERDIAGINIGQAGKIKLTSVPNEIFEVTVKSITPISEIREGKNYFRVEATLNREAESLRPGMTGSGKILAGSHLLGWVWFHDIWYWLRLKLWL
jgi:multidrug resistance efflux pump